MAQILIDKDSISNNTATITGADAHHIISVLRLKKGDWIVLTDGEGNRYRAELLDAKKTHVRTQIIETIRTKWRPVEITLAQSTIKHDRMEWIIQKSIELGCHNFIPLITDRTVPKLTAGTSVKKIERWQKIAIEAMKQCGTPYKPLIEKPRPFSELINEFKRFSHVILFWEGERKMTFSSFDDKKIIEGDKVLLIIGPEGGFTQKEIEEAKKGGAVTASLGPLILRVETAAVAAITLMQFKLGHFDAVPL